ncbi:MAG: AAA family ATPase [Chitinophagales bacterium]
MKITKLRLENFRGFAGVHEFELPDGNITAIIGVNGAGKTSVLDAMAIVLYKMLKYGMGNVTEKKEKSIEFLLNDITIKQDLSSIHLYINRKINEISGYISDRTYSGWLDNDKLFEEKTEKSLHYKNFFINKPLPILIYYRSHRDFTGNGYIDYTFNYKNSAIWSWAYENAFDTIINYDNIVSWYLGQINIENNEKVKRKNFDYELPTISAIKKAIQRFLQSLEGTDLKGIALDVSPYNRTQQTLMIQKTDVDLEFSQLSAGEKMMIGIVLDIAYRMSIANPHLENPLQTDGIILIDEIELHLHPKWQMSVLQALSKTFPNVQFIVTTHSPLVINQLNSNQLLILDNFKIIEGKKLHNTYGRDVNAIVSDFMGAAERPHDIKKRLKEIEDELNEDVPNIALATQKLDTLKSIIDPNDYEILKLETLIAIEADELD